MLCFLVGFVGYSGYVLCWVLHRCDFRVGFRGFDDWFVLGCL